ncbi:MAG: aminotransferase class I/II-fold pyridoxal phosphate-dependent enzyme [Bacteroidota bacterium]
MKPNQIKPQTSMMGHGYEASDYGGAVKCPIFMSSTYVFPSAEEGKRQFELAYGLREREPNEKSKWIYSRINNPNLDLAENRLKQWEKAEEALLFSSGMAAITTTLFTYLRPGDYILYSNPLYGGSAHFIQEILPEYGINVISFNQHDTLHSIKCKLIEAKATNKLKLIYAETPANPTNTLIDIAMLAELRDTLSELSKPLLLVDNTYMGPLWQQPLTLGADLVLYSATKYIGGHSDLIAGACLGNKEMVAPVRNMRTFVGSMADANTAWLICRSLETLKIRMDIQAQSTLIVSRFLASHPKIDQVYYPGLLTAEDGKQYEIYKKQCTTGGGMISFTIKGGEKEAFRFLNHLNTIKLAVSLGSTESLVQHPITMTHVGLDEQQKEELSITPSLIRLSVGLEDPNDLINDIESALSTVNKSALALVPCNKS